MTYCLMNESHDGDIPRILSVYALPTVAPFISIDEENYWNYVTGTDQVWFYKAYKEERLIATIHLESVDAVLYMSIVVFPEYQKQGFGTEIIKDIQNGVFDLDFNKIQVSVDEKNGASLRLFEKAGFVCIGKEEELLEYMYIKK